MNRKRAFLAIILSATVVAPWVLRNAREFGRLVPIKSNLAYELYQSQCLQVDGVLQDTNFWLHPINSFTPEGEEYRRLGETAYLDRKREQFRSSVRDDPGNWLHRLFDRLCAATIVFVPLEREREPTEKPVRLWLCRLFHPLPFLAAIRLLILAWRSGITKLEATLLVVYLSYLSVYVAVSYYDRYAIPLLAVKTLLTVSLLVRGFLSNERGRST